MPASGESKTKTMSATAHDPYDKLQKELASLLVTVAGQSVTMVKRSVPEQALKMKKATEWDIYLEFLKVFFNLADRLSAFYLPIQLQPRFMDGLEDAVTHQLKTALAPALGPDSDEMEITVTIGQTVAESRQRYESYRFVVKEESKVRDEYFKHFAEQVAALVGASGNGMLQSSAVLCASAVIPAMSALFDSMTGTAANPQATGSISTGQAHPATGTRPAIGNDIKLVSVMATVQGEMVDTTWGVHPRFRQDLPPDQFKELSRLMNRVARLIGERYAAVAFSDEWAAWATSDPATQGARPGPGRPGSSQ